MKICHAFDTELQSVSPSYLNTEFRCLGGNYKSAGFKAVADVQWQR